MQARGVLYQRQRRDTILAGRTGPTPARIEKDSDRGNYMSVHQGAEYGLADREPTARVAA